MTALQTRFKTGETSPYTARFRFDGYLDGTWSPAPTPEEKEIPMDKGDTFPPIRSTAKGCWWRKI